MRFLPTIGFILGVLFVVFVVPAGFFTEQFAGRLLGSVIVGPIGYVVGIIFRSSFLRYFSLRPW